MDKVKAFFARLGKAAVNLWNGFKALPIVKPLFGLVYSRKAMIASALTGFMLETFPKLVPVKSELDVVTAQVVVIALAWLANMVGISIEDAAKKSAEKAPDRPAVVNAYTTTVSPPSELSELVKAVG